jgi:hypothetical protein
MFLAGNFYLHHTYAEVPACPVIPVLHQYIYIYNFFLFHLPQPFTVIKSRTEVTVKWISTLLHILKVLVSNLVLKPAIQIEIFCGLSQSLQVRSRTAPHHKSRSGPNTSVTAHILQSILIFNANQSELIKVSLNHKHIKAVPLQA